MSENDLKTLGHSIGFSPTLDNPKAAKYLPLFANTASTSGNGLSNNRVFANTSDNQTAAGDKIHQLVTLRTNIKLVDMLI